MDDALRLVERRFAAGDASLDELVVARQRAGVRLCPGCRGSGDDPAPEPDTGPCWVCEGGRTEEAYLNLVCRDVDLQASTRPLSVLGATS